MHEKKLIILCGPSGSGKTTLARHMLEKIPQLSFSISATTRPMRHGEKHGRDYYFLSVEEFQEKIAGDEFIEFEEVYKGTYYGTLRSEMERIWESQHLPILDIDVLGALNIKEKYTGNALAIFVHPLNLDNIRQRLAKRATESPESFEKRVARAQEELDLAERFDKVIYNEDLEHAVVKAEEYIYDYLFKDKKLLF